MPNLDSLLSHLLATDPDDPFDLAAVVGRLRAGYPTARPAEIRWMALELIRHLLGTGVATAGWLAPGDAGAPRQFRPWALTAGQALTRITREWDELAREPKPGEIAWFAVSVRPEVQEAPADDELGRANA